MLERQEVVQLTPDAEVEESRRVRVGKEGEWLVKTHTKKRAEQNQWLGIHGHGIEDTWTHADRHARQGHLWILPGLTGLSHPSAGRSTLSPLSENHVAG